MTHVLPHSLRLPHAKSVRDHRKEHAVASVGFLLPNHLPERGVVSFAFPTLTCSVRFTQAHLGDAARVTVRSSPLHHTILIAPVRRCHGDRRCTVPEQNA